MDEPSIPWRGRPHSVAAKHLEPGTLDAYIWARMNFIDLRFAPGGSAPFGIPPGYDFDKGMAAEILREAQRRGMFVYGTVSCGVKPDKFEAALGTFEELIRLGVDGLWISFDDPGPGRDASVLIRRVLALGKQHGMDGRTIAITPPSGSYQHIDTEFNRDAVSVAGMADITWFFTRVPCGADVTATKALGLTRLPAWWHNWPRTSGGFTHDSYGGSSLRPEGKPAYLDLTPLQIGWHNPRYDKLRDARETTDTVMFWGGWPEEYTACALGLWAWNPATHDWEALRTWVYAHVFGADLSVAAREFDDTLAELKALCHLPVRRTRPKKGWPCRLKRPEDRSKALALLATLDDGLKRLQENAPGQTVLLPARLQKWYLEPMRATVDLARTMMALDYPEYALDDLGAQALKLWTCGQPDQLESLLATRRDEWLPKLARIDAELGHLAEITASTKLWRERLSGVDYWKGFCKKQDDAMRQRFNEILRTPPDFGELLAGLDAPSTRSQPLSTLTVAEIAQGSMSWRGAWGLGTHETEGKALFAIAFPGQTRSEPGEHAQVDFTVTVPRVDGRLSLEFYMTDTHVTDRWTTYRYNQVLSGDTVLWEEDIALPTAGKERRTVEVTELARGRTELPLTFRVLDRRGVSNYRTVTFLGDVRLVRGE